LSHEKAFPEEKREMFKIFTSNRQLDRKNLNLKPSIPFQEIADRFKNPHCDPHQDIPRTWDRILRVLAKLSFVGQLPDLSTIFHSREKPITAEDRSKRWNFDGSGN